MDGSFGPRAGIKDTPEKRNLARTAPMPTAASRAEERAALWRQMAEFERDGGRVYRITPKNRQAIEDELRAAADAAAQDTKKKHRAVAEAKGLAALQNVEGATARLTKAPPKRLADKVKRKPGNAMSPEERLRRNLERITKDPTLQPFHARVAAACKAPIPYAEAIEMGIAMQAMGHSWGTVGIVLKDLGLTKSVFIGFDHRNPTPEAKRAHIAKLYTGERKVPKI